VLTAKGFIDYFNNMIKLMEGNLQREEKLSVMQYIKEGKQKAKGKNEEQKKKSYIILE
jgi:hypothetical protein